MDQPGIFRQLPFAEETVGIHDERCSLGPRVLEFLNPAGFVTDGAILGDETAGGSSVEDGGRNIADADVANETPLRIEFSERDRSAASLAEGIVEGLHQVWQRTGSGTLEDGYGLFGGFGGMRAMAEAIGDHDPFELRMRYVGPGIAAARLALDRQADRTRLKP